MAKKLSSMYKSTLVTGASSGLGRSFAEMLVDEGIDVWGTSRNPSKMQTKPGINRISLDLLDNTSVNALLDQINNGDLKIDLLINNAGSAILGNFQTFSEENITQQLELLLQNQIKLTQACYKKMTEQGAGCIVNVTSMAAEYPIPYMSLYNSCKAGLSAFTQSLMLESDKIKCIDLQPGDFDTGFAITHSGNWTPEPQKVYEVISKRTQESPGPHSAAVKLRKILLKNKSGSYRIGSFAQAQLYPVLLKFLPLSARRKILRAYYKL